MEPDDNKYSELIAKLFDTMYDDDTDEMDVNYNQTKGKVMKKCEVCMPDGNGKISIGIGCTFISPTTTGFMLYSNPKGEIEIHCFADYESLLGYMKDNVLFDITQTKVANNI